MRARQEKGKFCEAFAQNEGSVQWQSHPGELSWIIASCEPLSAQPGAPRAGTALPQQHQAGAAGFHSTGNGNGNGRENGEGQADRRKEKFQAATELEV